MLYDSANGNKHVHCFEVQFPPATCKQATEYGLKYKGYFRTEMAQLAKF